MCRYKKEMLDTTMNKVDEVVSAIAIMDKKIDSSREFPVSRLEEMEKDICELKRQNGELYNRLEVCLRKIDKNSSVCISVDDKFEKSKNKIAMRAAAITFLYYIGICIVIAVIQNILKRF